MMATTKMLTTVCLLGLPGCGALSLQIPVAGGRQTRSITASAAPGADDRPVAAADAAAAERLWSSSVKPLLRIGKHGAKASHASGLADLCEHQPFVSVRFTGPRTDESLSSLLAELGQGQNQPAPVLLTSRKPRRGGLEALFAQPARVDDVCSAAFHDALAAAALAKVQQATEWAEGRPSPKPRSAPIVAMAKGFDSIDVLEAAVRSYIAGLPEGQADDPALPSPLDYKELKFNGRPDLVDGLIAFGGYIKMSEQLELPIRIGVERPAGDAPAPSAGADAAKTIGGLFNLFGKG